MTSTALVLIGDNLTVALAIASWGFGGLAAACFGLFQLRVRSIGGTRRWIQEQRDLAIPYTIERLAATGTATLTIVFVGQFAGFAAAGAVRGVQVLLGPLVVLFAAVTLTAVPHLAALRPDLRRIRRDSVLLSGGYVAVWMAAGTTLLLVPD